MVHAQEQLTRSVQVSGDTLAVAAADARDGPKPKELFRPPPGLTQTRAQRPTVITKVTSTFHYERWGALYHRPQGPQAHHTRQHRRSHRPPLGPQTHRGDPKQRARSRRSRSPHAPAHRRARTPRAQRVPAVLSAAWLPMWSRISLQLSAPGPAYTRHQRAGHECMRHVGIMRACTRLHAAEVRPHHHPHPFHAKGSAPRPVSRPRAHVPLDLMPALRPGRAGLRLVCASCSSLRSSIQHWRPRWRSASAELRCSPSGEGHAHAASLRAT